MSRQAWIRPHALVQGIKHMARGLYTNSLRLNSLGSTDWPNFASVTILELRKDVVIGHLSAFSILISYL
jgi:hypothetical protein